MVRVRFSPSPTGYLHLGGVRTALFNWLFARHEKGSFLLRIEDTDLKRSEKRFTEDIFSALKWLGLDWDEEVVFQSQRMEQYRKKAHMLVQEGKAYYCTCSLERLDSIRKDAMDRGEKPKYDGKCRDSKKTIPQISYVIRMKLPQEGETGFYDHIRGSVRVQNQELDDFIILRSNNTPTYHFAVVIDDIEMSITHVIRGEDHVSNTPKQLFIYEAFGKNPPSYAHLPMILGSDRKKLSKRHGHVSVNVYRAEGYLSEAILNFLARLGWSHRNQEIFSKEELIHFFDLNHVQKSGAVCNFEKLRWLNGEHLRKLSAQEVQKRVLEDFKDLFLKEILSFASTEHGRELLSLVQPKVKDLKTLVDQWIPLCMPDVIDLKGMEKELLGWDDTSPKWSWFLGTTRFFFESIQGYFEEVESQNHLSKYGCLEEVGVSSEQMRVFLKAASEKFDWKFRDFMLGLRVFLTGRKISPGLFELLVKLPSSVVKKRILYLLETVEKRIQKR